MKKFASAVAIAAAFCLPSIASATTIDFNTGLNGFFNYTNVATIGTVQVGSGYDNMYNFNAGGLAAFNPYAAPVVSFTKAGAGTFTLNSMLVDGAWGSQTLTFIGLASGSTLYTTTFGVSQNPAELVLNWSGINEFRVLTGTDFVDGAGNGSGLHWVIDNVVVDEVTVPEPAPLALLGLGMIGLLARKKFAAKKAA
jgi:hypothetical protein